MPQHTNEICRLLRWYGGALVNADGIVRQTLTFVRVEGHFHSRLLHMECVDTRQQKMFVLEEDTGDYVSGTDRLWPLGPSPSAANRLASAVAHLGKDLGRLVEGFLEEAAPFGRPRHAKYEHLRKQVLWTLKYPDAWQEYWARGDTLCDSTVVGTTRLRPNIWKTRKRYRHS